MREYTLRTLKLIEYAGIYLKMLSAEYVRFVNVPDAVHVIKDTIPFTELSRQLSRQKYSELCQTFKMECFTKSAMPECRFATRNFSGQDGGGGLWN